MDKEGDLVREIAHLQKSHNRLEVMHNQSTRDAKALSQRVKLMDNEVSVTDDNDANDD